MKGGGSPEGIMGVLVVVLPSMPKGETVGNIFIDGKGAPRSSTKTREKLKLRKATD